MTPRLLATSLRCAYPRKKDNNTLEVNNKISRELFYTELASEPLPRRFLHRNEAQETVVTPGDTGTYHPGSRC